MPIPKQAFYEGAALYLIARTGSITHLVYEAPFFLLNRKLLALLKYSTAKRSPWGFTFGGDEQRLLRRRSRTQNIVLAFICGADGIAALEYESFVTIAAPKASPIHISCYRDHGQQYEINGPDGVLTGKIPPSHWQRILEH